ncbi:MAG: hypothetical protein QXX36_00250 [Candidatus Rehaiarchaeum fermentans]|nr:hypothetical protein [Candidatus Rehaiarchaeum fermentans]MCW1297164.1 hypothetical protein [Candidatus Rehaiarchaeum fermentans]MCW1302059.1 hypothetical protein [Candidatus Rehaiarchaeum fermentans]
MDQLPITSKKFSYTGIIDVNGFLQVVKKNLEAKGFSVEETKFEQSGSENKNYSIEWSATKQLDDYTMYSLTVKINFSDVKDATVLKNNVPTQTKIGKVDLSIDASMMLDYQEKWSAGLLKILRPLFDRMNKELIESRKKSLANSVDEIVGALKSTYS